MLSISLVLTVDENDVPEDGRWCVAPPQFYEILRQAEIEKTPYMIIIGNQEKVYKKISVRKYGGENLGTMEINDFIKTINYDINNEIKPFINTKF